MAERKVIETVEFLRETLKRKGIQVEKIVVFGSQIKGETTSESDIDLVIVSEDFRGKDIFEKSAMLSGIEWEVIKRFMIPLDIVTLSPEEWESESSILVSYAREGEVLYG